MSLPESVFEPPASRSRVPCPNGALPSFLFCSCVCFCLYGPFNCISFPKFSRQLSAFSFCYAGLISALLVLSTICFFMKVFLSPPRSGELRTQKLKSHLVRTQSLNVLPLKPGVGQYIVYMLRLLPGISFLLISTLPIHSPAFFQNLPGFSCVGCG